MDRRQFGKLFVALFAGKAVAEIATGSTPPFLEHDRQTRLLLEGTRTNSCGRGCSEVLDNATWEPVARFNTTIPITQELLDDCVVDVVAEIRARERALLLYGSGRAAPRGIMNANTVAVEKLANGWRHITEVHRA